MIMNVILDLCLNLFNIQPVYLNSFHLTQFCYKINKILLTVPGNNTTSMLVMDFKASGVPSMAIYKDIPTAVLASV